MNQNFYQMGNPNPKSGLGCLVFLLLVGLIFGPAGLGWVVNGILLLMAAIVVIPIVTIVGLQWYLRKNQLASNCPQCGYEFVAMKNTNVTCGQCGEKLRAGNTSFDRYTPEGTIEVNAVTVGDQDSDDQTITVEVLPPQEDASDD